MNSNHPFLPFLNLLKIFVITVIIGQTPTAFAQLNVSPLVLEADTRQGLASKVITLTNQGTNPVRVRLYSLPFTYTLKGFEVLPSDPQDVSPYLSYSPRELVVEPGQLRRIRLLVRLLPSLPAGEYRSVIFTEPLKEQAGPGKLAVKNRVGVTFYVRHNKPTAQLEVEGASFNAKTRQIDLLVSNGGNATNRPLVDWNLKQGNAEIASGRESATTVIAQGKRNITLDPPAASPLQAGDYELTGTLLWGDPRNQQKIPFKFNLSIPVVNAPEKPVGKKSK